MDVAEQTQLSGAARLPNGTDLQTGTGAGPSLLLSETFQRARSYIAAHYGDPELDAIGIARQLHCSRATLYRAFQANEATVGDHIQNVRIYHVLVGFATSPPRTSISSIAMDCGFECVRHFNRRFKKLLGVTPGACRKALRGRIWLDKNGDC